MDLRLKLILPAFLLLSAVSALLHFFWLPYYLNTEIEQQLSHERAYIKLLGDILTSDLISNDLAKMYETLDRTLEDRSNWHAIKLYKYGQLRIYPLHDEPLPESGLETLHYSIQHNNETIANMTAWIDIQSNIAMVENQISYLEQLLLSLVFGATLIAILLQDRWIRTPLKQLASVASDISKGKYDSTMRYQSKDEVGNLVDSINYMREQIHEREEKLTYYSQLQNTIRHIQDKFIRNINGEQVFSDLQQQILELTNSKHGFISEVIYGDNDISYLKTFSASSLFISSKDNTNETMAKGEGIEFHDLESLPCGVLATGKSVIINEPDTSEEYPAIPGLKNFLGLPISSAGKLIGVVGVANCEGGYSPSLYDDLQVLLVTLSGLIIAYREEKALKESEARYRAVVNDSPYGITTVNKSGIIVSCNSAAERIFAYPHKELIGKSIKILIPQEYHAEYEELMHNYVSNDDKGITGIGRVAGGLRKDGRVFPLEISVSELALEDETLLMGITKDISKRIYAERAQQRYSEALEQLHTIISATGFSFDQKIHRILRLGQKIFNLPLAIISHIQDEKYIVKYIAGPEGAPAPGAEFPLGETYCCHTLSSTEPTSFHHAGKSIISTHPCYTNFGLESYIGTTIYVGGERYGTLNFSGPEPKTRPFTSVDNTLIQLFSQWIGSEMNRVNTEIELEQAYINVNIANAKLEELSRTDSLTCVANRRYFDEVFSQEINRAMRHIAPVTLIICDIDHFKNYNDTYGHQAGDTCLQQVTKAIQSSFSRAGELVARYGGEEFAIVIPDIEEENAMKLAEEMRNNVSMLKIDHKASPIADHVTMSVGVATLIPDQNTTMSVLIERADSALYEAKKNGRNKVQSYSSH